MTKAEIDDIFGEFEIDEDYMIKTKDVIGLFVSVKEEPKVEEPAPVEEVEAEPEEDADAKKKMVTDMNEDGSKTVHRFHKVVRGGKTSSVQAMIYNFGFAFCEVLNLVVILISQSMLNSLFNDEYSSYGVNVQTYRSF